MRLRLHNIAIRYDASIPDALDRAVRSRLGEDANRLASWHVVRRSIDARKAPVKLIFTVDIAVRGDGAIFDPTATVPPQEMPLRVSPGGAPFPGRPVVVGGGPAGLFAALLLAEHGYRPLLLERGGTSEERTAALGRFDATREPDPECNALFGLGGAGTFSDGKLSTSIGHGWIPEILRVFADCGAPTEILSDAKPHIGTDLLPAIITRLVSRIEAAGGTVRTSVRAEDFEVREDKLAGVWASGELLDTGVVVLAIGHSARDTWAALRARGIAMEPKPFQLGVRAEHPQAWLDERQYGIAAGHPSLGAADYKLTAKPNGVPVFSFCMCPGGETIPTVNEIGHLCLNGMSKNARDSAFASSGLVVTLTPEMYGGRDLDTCLSFVRGIEARCFSAGGSSYSAPGQRIAEFAGGHTKRPSPLPRSSYRLGAIACALDTVLPACVGEPLRLALRSFDRTIPGYVHPDAVLLAPESRASSPVRIVRNAETRESIAVLGLYPVGEGAGYAGGIVSAALDGLRSARSIIEKYAPPSSN